MTLTISCLSVGANFENSHDILLLHSRLWRRSNADWQEKSVSYFESCLIPSCIQPSIICLPCSSCMWVFPWAVDVVIQLVHPLIGTPWCSLSTQAFHSVFLIRSSGQSPLEVVLLYSQAVSSLLFTGAYVFMYIILLLPSNSAMSPLLTCPTRCCCSDISFPTLLALLLTIQLLELLLDPSASCLLAALLIPLWYPSSSPFLKLNLLNLSTESVYCNLVLSVNKNTLKPYWPNQSMGSIQYIHSVIWYKLHWQAVCHHVL